MGRIFGSTNRIPLLVIMLLAFGVRAVQLDAQSLWYDEGVTAYISGLDMAALTQWTANDIQPPLYYYLVALWQRAAGTSEWSLRFVSVFFGTLTVPLMGALAQRLTRSHRATSLTALFTALHPLLIYYSQEARMYALLVALGVLIGYLVVRLADGDEQRGLWATYIVAATAAIYTHYFAFFLLLALGIAYLLDLYLNSSDTEGHKSSHRGPQSFFAGVIRFAISNLIVLALYLPWFTIMFRRLAVDTSYWQGEFKLSEAMRTIAISFTSGETVTEQQGVWLLLLYAAVTVIAVIGLIRGGKDSRRTLRYGLLWLFVPIIAVLTLASFAPKFNARYVMIALPGLLLIWGAGITNWRLRIEDSVAAPNHRVTLSPAHTVANLSILALAIGFTYATLNWFTNPTFTKDDWRGVVEFMRPRLQEHEAIALISGHTWPVWDYYAADLPALRLPDLRILDVEAVLDFSDTAEALQATLDPLADRPGIWLIEWQEDVVDPTGVVPVQLLIAGKEKGLDTHYWGLTLRRFSQIKTNWIPDAPPIKTPLEVNFDDQLLLHGYNAIDSGDLLLFWQRAPGHHPDATNYVISGEVYDSDGELLRSLPDQRPGGYDYPVERWPDERIAMGVFAARDWLGDDPQPGRYSVRLRVYDDRGSGRVLLATADGREEVELSSIEVVLE